jgi:uncharacterized protein (TIGR03437 family)
MLWKFCVLLAALQGTGWSQIPVISPNGIVNAASYAIGIESVNVSGIASGSLGSIFGANLAIAPQLAQGYPWPLTLGGTSVMVYGVPAHLL